MPGGSDAIGKVNVIGALGAAVGATVGASVGFGAVVLVGAAVGLGGGVSVGLTSPGCVATAWVGAAVVAGPQAANSDAPPNNAAAFKNSLRLIGLLDIFSPFVIERICERQLTMRGKTPWVQAK